MDQEYCPYCMNPVEKDTPCPACGLTAGAYAPSPPPALRHGATGALPGGPAGRTHPRGELLHIIEPLFSALAAMHRQGLIHRDISPESLMLEHGDDLTCAPDGDVDVFGEESNPTKDILDPWAQTHYLVFAEDNMLANAVHVNSEDEFARYSKIADTCIVIDSDLTLTRPYWVTATVYIPEGVTVDTPCPDPGQEEGNCTLEMCEGTRYVTSESVLRSALEDDGCDQVIWDGYDHRSKININGGELVVTKGLILNSSEDNPADLNPGGVTVTGEEAFPFISDVDYHGNSLTVEQGAYVETVDGGAFAGNQAEPLQLKHKICSVPNCSRLAR